MDFFTFFEERCKAHNRSLDASPGLHLPEAGAMALNDFLNLIPVPCCKENVNEMTLKKLLEDVTVQQLLKSRLDTGEKFELISVKTGEKMTFEQLKKRKFYD